MQYQLRPYQSRCLEDCIKYVEDKQNKKKAIVIAPMGSGKSLSIAAIANYVKEPVINISPNKELLVQNYEKYTSYGNPASIYSASLNTKQLGHVTFATIGSIKAETQRIKNMGVRLLTVDECNLGSKHGSQLSKFINETGIEKIIGFSAFPIEMAQWGNTSYLKMINRSRGNLFQEIIHCTQIKEIVDGGFWAKLVYQQKEVDESKLVLNSNKSDYTEKSLVEFYKGNSLRERIANEVFRLQAEGRKSILIFVPTINEANQLSELIPNSYAVSSETPQKERDIIVKGFKNLQIGVAINVNIFSYGFDNPQLDGIITGRPTNSFVLFAQQLGRGVRPHPNKKDCLIVDFAGNVAKFGKLENIEFKHEENRWGMFSGTQQLTSGDVFKPKKSDIFNGIIWFGNKHNGKHINYIVKFDRQYLEWIAKNFKADTPKVKEMLVQINRLLQGDKVLS